MNLRHAAALALVGWYLMIPPIDYTGTHRTPAISLWATLKVFDTAVECSAALKDVQDKAEKQIDERLDAWRGNRPKTEETINEFFNKKWTTVMTEASAQNARCIATDDPRLKEK
jgi:hypothetical protein